jgi:chorismate-pyruvate lyase
MMNGKTAFLTPIPKKNLSISPQRSYIEPSLLSTFQRILLTTNGTITDMIEAYAGEQIKLVKLSEEIISLKHDIPEMQLKQGDEVVERKILLRGSISQRNYVYADSLLVLNRLEDSVKEELLNTKKPIGKVWVEQKIAIFKENVDSGRESANDLANYFNIEPQENLIFRTYCVISNKKYTMMITEKFPESYFQKVV